MKLYNLILGIPFALSPPHFLNFNGSWNYYLKGLNARSPEHYGYIIVEPITGVALEISPVVQVNMVISKLNLNSEINMLSGKILPLVWVKYVKKNFYISFIKYKIYSFYSTSKLII